MAIRTLIYNSNTWLPIEPCQTVGICLSEIWADQTVSGVAIVNATVLDSIRELGNAGRSFLGRAFRWNTRRRAIVQYRFSIDDTQFLDDPETEEPFVVACDDIIGVNPYPCAMDAVLNQNLASRPLILSATVPAAGTSLVLVFNQDILPASAITGFTVAVGVTNNVITSAIRTADRTITLALTDVVVIGDVVTYDYTPGNVTDEDGNPLAPITNAAVTNSSTQP